MAIDPKLKALYDPAQFEPLAHALVTQLAAYVKDSQEHPSGLTQTDPQSLARFTLKALEQGNRGQGLPFEQLLDQYLAHTNHLQSPHYMGHQVSVVPPLLGVVEAVGAVLNNNSGIYEMGPFASSAERALVYKLGQKLGWASETPCDLAQVDFKSLPFDGFATHGGSAATLTALLAARNRALKGAWAKGVTQSDGAPVILTSNQAHYSVARAAGICGVGAGNVIGVETDANQKLSVPHLREHLVKLQKQGRPVVAIVASSCTTSTGTFDPLQAIADLAQEFGVWLHVDAAHGGGLMMSERHRTKLSGIERADSITWDAHKMMMVPALCTFVLFKRKVDSFSAFDQDAPYLWDEGNHPTLEFDSAMRTLECTRRPLVMALWFAWSLWGEGIFEAFVDRLCETTQEFYELLSAAPDFEATHNPEANILCFRYIPKTKSGTELSESELNELQKKIRARVIGNERFFITATTLKGLEEGVQTLRVTIMNPQTERSHLLGLLDEIRESAQSII